MLNVRSLQDTDPSEHALRIAKVLDRRITLVEGAQVNLELKLEKLIRSEGKRSAARLSMIGAIGVALIGAFAQWQVARIQAPKQNLESVIADAARKGAEAALAAEKGRR